MPFVVNSAVIEMIARADAATMVQFAFYSSPATMILRFGSDTQKQRWVPRLASGEIIGWVAMTEPEAGSDVGNISTAATRQADGTWRINGRKQFISSGNGEVGVLLARAVRGSNPSPDEPKINCSARCPALLQTVSGSTSVAPIRLKNLSGK